MIIENKYDELHNYKSVFDQAYEIKKIRRTIKNQKFTVTGTHFGHDIRGEFKITHIKKITLCGYSVNIKIKGISKFRHRYWGGGSDIERRLESIKDLSEVRRRNNGIRSCCVKDVSDFLKYFSVPYYNIVIGNVKICGSSEEL